MISCMQKHIFWKYLKAKFSALQVKAVYCDRNLPFQPWLRGTSWKTCLPQPGYTATCLEREKTTKSIIKPCSYRYRNIKMKNNNTGELGYDRLNGTRRIGASHAKSVVYIWRILDMHRTGTKHIVCHMQKSVVQWSVISKFTCIYLNIRLLSYPTKQSIFKYSTNPGPAEPRSIWETLTNLICVARKYLYVLSDLLMSLQQDPHRACTWPKAAPL